MVIYTLYLCYRVCKRLRGEWKGCREFEVDFSGALIKEWLPGLDKVCKKDKKKGLILKGSSWSMKSHLILKVCKMIKSGTTKIKITLNRKRHLILKIIISKKSPVYWFCAQGIEKTTLTLIFKSFREKIKKSPWPFKWSTWV